MLQLHDAQAGLCAQQGLLAPAPALSSPGPTEAGTSDPGQTRGPTRT